MSAFTKTLIFSLTLFSFLSPAVVYSAAPKKEIYYIGGGGEPKGNSTIFDNDLALIGDFLNKTPEWRATVGFNGGHANTEEIIKSKMGPVKNAGDFTKANYNSMLEEMIKKIETGELKAGDQLMVNIDSHGAKRGSENTHSISLSRSTATNLTTLEGSRTVGLDGLEKLAKLASEKGVKLAIVDASCFSGNLLNIKNNNVCLISATGTDQYGYAGTIDAVLFKMKFTFYGNFISNLKKGTNLEEAFLKARESSYTPDFPMISSEEGRAINDQLYKLLSPYLTFDENKSLDFTKTYPRDIAKFEEKVCQYNQGFSQLESLLKSYESIRPVTDFLNRNEFTKLLDALRDYRKLQVRFENAMRSKLKLESEIKSVITQKFPDKVYLLKDYNAVDLLSTDFQKQIEMYNKTAQFSSRKEAKKEWLQTLAELKVKQKNVNMIRESLSSSTQADLRKIQLAYDHNILSRSHAESVASEAKKVYLKMYRKLMKKSVSNPCRDFVL